MAAAKQNILTTPPAPEVRGQRRPRRQARLPGPGRRPRPDRARQGRDADALLEARGVARPGVEDVHAPQRRQQEVHQRRSRAREGEVSGRRLEGGRDHSRSAQHPFARELGSADGRGLRRIMARADAYAGQGGTARRRGAGAGGDHPGQREACRRGGAQALRRAHGDQGAQDRRQAGRRGVGVGAVDGRRSSTR